MQPVLVIDIGNTSTSLGLYRNGSVEQTRRVPTHFQNPAEVRTALPKEQLGAVVIASVVPSAITPWEQLIQEAGTPAPLIVHHRLNLGVPVDYPQPETIGPDRLANAAAAAHLAGTPCVVCDFGTALTFDILHGERGYIGGIICPGLPLMFDYLAEKTALLPRVTPRKTEQVVGKSTEEAMQIGARIGYRGMVREILSSLEKELGSAPLPLLCTGGYAPWIFEGWDIPAQIDPLLTLYGLGVIAELNL
jgi:type III pantothenate kinase